MQVYIDGERVGQLDRDHHATLSFAAASGAAIRNDGASTLDIVVHALGAKQYTVSSCAF